MRKLTAQFLALALAVIAYTNAVEPADGHSLWWSGFLAVAAMLIFAVASGSLSSIQFRVDVRAWSTVVRAMALAAALLAVAIAIFVSEPSLSLIAWAVAVLLLITGLLWPDRQTSYERPAYKWTTDAAGNWVRAVLGVSDDAGGAHRDPTLASSRRILHAALALAIGVGVFLRLWRLMDGPPECILQECDVALRLVNQPDFVASFYDALSAFLYRFTQNALASLRITSALIGIVTLPVFYWATLPLVRSYGAALATILLALCPWHIWISRTSEPIVISVLIILLVIGMGVRAFRSADRRWWGGLGLAFGLLLLDVSPTFASLLWVVLILAGALWIFLSTPGAKPRLAAAMVAAGRGLIVALLPGWRLFAFYPLHIGNELVWALEGWQATLTPLFNGGSAFGYFMTHPLLGALPFALAMLGMGLLFRSVMRPYATIVTAGFFAVLAGYLLSSGGASTTLSAPTMLMPFLFVAVAVSLETLTISFYNTWRVLVSARTAVIVALLIVVIPSGWRTVAFVRSMDDASVRVNRTVDESIGRHIAHCLSEQTVAACVFGTDNADDPTPFDTVIYAPKGAVEHTATQLLLGNNADDGRVRTLDIARDLPPSPMPENNALYLVPIDDRAAINLLREFYPNAETYALPTDAAPTQFVAIAVYQTDLLQRQGLEGLYFEGTDYGVPEDAALRSRDGPLSFAWSANPPLPGSFSVIWEGSLQAPASGVYRFVADLPIDADDGQTAFTLQLDDRLVLDSSLGLFEKDELLAQGFYRLTIHYRSDQPQDWSILWQTPGSELDVVPRDALYSPALPDVGLIGTYYAGDSTDGPVLSSRKDLILSNNADLPHPYSVVWEGKLAAPRAGDYLFSVTSNGALRLTIDGHSLIDHQPEAEADDESTPVYTQASIYLPRDWHSIQIEYSPAEMAPELRILWQPPGSSPSLLDSLYLRPELGQITVNDVALPEAPPLLDSTLGDESFALTYSSDLIRPQTVIPPMNLPSLSMQPVWQVGACGSGDGQFITPRGVAYDAESQRVYVADTGNRRVVALDAMTGEQLAVFDGSAFEEPVDVAMDTDGNLIVLDAVAHPLVRIDPATGDAEPIELDTSFYRPRGLDVDEQGVIAVADTGGARVILLEPSGRTILQYGGPETDIGSGQPVDAMLKENMAWAVTAEDGRLWRLMDESGLTALPRANTIDGPHLASLPGGGFFLTDPVMRSIRYHAGTGQPLAEYINADTVQTPVGIAAYEVNGQFHVVVADSAACTVTLWRGDVDALPK